MCGLFGVYNFNIKKFKIAREALKTLEHRGPDQWGDWFNDEIYLGHQRLSIIDLSEKGKQPMIDKSGDVAIVVNGEIYNYKDLKNQLKNKFKFFSKSDSEVLLYGYKEWGIDKLIEKIDGMYALLIYDIKNKLLYAVRDKFGKKPIFYTKIGNEYIFSSEVKAIFKFNESSKVFSKKGILDWLYNRGNISGITIYDNIYKIPPGTYLKLNKDSCIKKNYYNIFERITQFGKFRCPDYLEELESRLDIAVNKRLISDVPVGLQLSGGIDSSLIAYFIRKHHNEDLHSFSIGFSDIADKKFSEEKYARFVAEKLSLNHHQLNITQKDVLEEFERVIYLTDGMIDIPNTIPIYILSKYAKNYITVALTGEGADEAFGGYTKLNYPLLLALSKRKILRAPKWLIETIGSIKYNKFKNIARLLFLNKYYCGMPKEIINDINCYISPDTINKIFLNNIELTKITDIYSAPFKSDIDIQKKFLMYELVFYLFTLLERQDRASMGAGIESRLPFLDPIVVEWAHNLPNEQLFDYKQNKILLKKLSEKIFGKEFTCRPKSGFPLPIYKWMDDKEGFGKYKEKIFDRHSILGEVIDQYKLKQYLKSNSFSNKLLAYSDLDKMWLKWFLTVLRTTENIFGINDIR